MVLEDAGDLSRRLGRDDRAKLDEYLESVRSIEKRIESHDAPVEKPWRPLTQPEHIAIPDPTPPGNFAEHIKLMLDLIVLAFWTDSTRISTFMFANDVSGRNFGPLIEGTSGAHHEFSHHTGKAEKIEPYKKINRWHAAQLAYMLDRMSEISEGNGTLLDNSMILFGSSISDGDRHNPNNLPIILAGRGGHTIKTGQHIASPHNTPLCNLYASMLDRMGTPVESFGDSDGKLLDSFAPRLTLHPTPSLAACRFFSTQQRSGLGLSSQIGPASARSKLGLSPRSEQVLTSPASVLEQVGGRLLYNPAQPPENTPTRRSLHGSRTLILLKPDCIQRRLAGRILTRFEDKGFNIVALKLMRISPDLAKKHYAEHVQKGWYPTLESFITGGPIIAAIVEGLEAIRVVRDMVGATSGLKATAGTIRGDFSSSRQMNLVHASDGPEAAKREIELYFRSEEIQSHTPTITPWLRGGRRALGQRR